MRSWMVMSNIVFCLIVFLLLIFIFIFYKEGLYIIKDLVIVIIRVII